MQFFIFVLLICFLIFLFCLYLLANDDFVLLRKDVSTEKVFDMALVMSILSLLGARILYVIVNPNSGFLNPLVFIMFPYFPGLSLTGALIGALFAFFLFYAKYSKVPVGRLLDFFSISFLATLPVGLLGYLFLSWVDNEVKHAYIIGLIVVYIILLIVVLKFCLPALLSGKLKDGTICLIFLISFSTISFTENAIGRGGKNLLSGGIEDVALLLIFFVSLVFLFRQEKLLTKVKRLNFKNIAGLTKR